MESQTLASWTGVKEHPSHQSGTKVGLHQGETPGRHPRLLVGGEVQIR